MSNNIDDLFGDDDFVTTPAVADHVERSVATVRVYAVEMDVPRAGQAFVWSRENVETLIAALGVGDDDGEGDDDEPEEEDDDRDDDDQDEDEDEDDQDNE